MSATERLAYFDCASGASAEMLLGGLVSAGLLEADLRDLLDPLQRVGAAFDLRVEPVAKGPVEAVQVTVVDQVPDVEARLADMRALVDGAALAAPVRQASTAVLDRLASAIGRAGGKRPGDVVFPGTDGVDIVVGVVGVCAALDFLEVRTVFCSPVNVGQADTVVAALLAEAPTYEESPGLPLVTPAAAAILAELASEWPASPPFAGAQVGYGAGLRDLPRPNVVRCFLGYGTIAGAG